MKIHDNRFQPFMPVVACLDPALGQHARTACAVRLAAHAVTAFGAIVDKLLAE
jgi:hypothetical protein